MSLQAAAHGARLRIEPLEDRCTPSAWLGDHPAFAHGHHWKPPAPAAAHFAGHNQHHAVPITLSAHITSDGSGGLNLSGVGSHLGRWTGQGVIDNVVIDEAADHAAISGTVTIRAANGDQLFGSFSISLNLTTGHGEEVVTFTGGTGRFAGAAGSVSLACETNWNPASPLTFECDAQGSGTLVFGHPQCEGQHEKNPDGKHEKNPDGKHEKIPDGKHEKNPDGKQRK